MRRGAGLEEIERVYRERVGDFRRVAAAIVGERELALDAVQEAFASAVRRRSSFRGDAPLEAWLWRIVVNHALSERRTTTKLAEAFEPTANGHAADDDEQLAAALLALTDRQRLVVFLRHYADLDYRTIAETLDVSPGTVAATLNQAHTSLRRALEEVPR